MVFAEDNYLVREGTAALLATVDEVELVGHGDHLDELLAAVEEHVPDAVLTDIRMPPTGTNEGIEAAKQIRAAHPEIGVVVLSQFAEEEYAYDLLKDGAGGLGYLLKERVADVEELVRALSEVARGGSVLDPKVVEALVAAKERMAHSPARPAHRPRARGARAHGAGAEQRRDREVAVPHRARRREAHQLPVPQAGSDGGAGRAPPGDGGARVPPRDQLQTSSTPSTAHCALRVSTMYTLARRVPQHQVRHAVADPPARARAAPRLPSTIVSARTSSATLADPLGGVAPLDPRAGRHAREPRAVIRRGTLGVGRAVRIDHGAQVASGWT